MLITKGQAIALFQQMFIKRVIPEIEKGLPPEGFEEEMLDKAVNLTCQNLRHIGAICGKR
jgi:hypothetical protein